MHADMWPHGRHTELSSRLNMRSTVRIVSCCVPAPTHANNMEKQWQGKCSLHLFEVDWQKRADLSCSDEVPSAVCTVKALFYKLVRSQGDVLLQPLSQTEWDLTQPRVVFSWSLQCTLEDSWMHCSKKELCKNKVISPIKYLCYIWVWCYIIHDFYNMLYIRVC